MCALWALSSSEICLELWCLCWWMSSLPNLDSLYAPRRILRSLVCSGACLQCIGNDGKNGMKSCWLNSRNGAGNGTVQSREEDHELNATDSIYTVDTDSCGIHNGRQEIATAHKIFLHASRGTQEELGQGQDPFLGTSSAYQVRILKDERAVGIFLCLYEGAHALQLYPVWTLPPTLRKTPAARVDFCLTHFLAIELRSQAFCIGMSRIQLPRLFWCASMLSCPELLDELTDSSKTKAYNAAE